MEYDQYVRTLINCKSIEDPSKIWWDIRPHSTFPTLEFRICDCVTKLDDAMAIAALIQALVAKLIQFRQSNQTWRKYRRSLIVENKWRACKNGIDGSLIDFGKEKEIPLRTLMEEMLILIDDVVDPLGSRQEIEHIRTILDTGTSADRQIACYEKTGSFAAVLDQLCEDTLEGC
jgi:carboxylate-amine ligase